MKNLFRQLSKIVWFFYLEALPHFVKDEIREFLEVRKSSKARQVKLRYRKGLFSVVVPEGLEIEADEVVERNFEWFESHLDEARRYRSQVPSRSFEVGESFSVLGKDREVVVEKRRSNEVKEDIFLAEHLVDRTGLKDQLEKALRSFAREMFEEKASNFSESINGDFNRIFVRDQETRWGSCSSRDNLNFNWRLVLGPEKVVDYVVVHELVHLEISNHGRIFERRVREIFPEASEAKGWLDENSAKLVFDPEF